MTKKQLFASLSVIIMIMLMSLTSCGASLKDNFLKEVNDIKVEDYMAEDQDTVKDLKDNFVKKIEKAKDEKAIKELSEDFKTELGKIATKADKVEAYKKLVSEQIDKLEEGKKAEAEEILKSFASKLDKVKSNKDLKNVSKEIEEALAAKGDEVKIDETAIESAAVQTSQYRAAKSSSASSSTSTPAKKQSSTSKPASTSSSKTSTSTSAKKPSNGGSSANKPAAKKKVWVVDKAAWTETVTKYRTETQQYTVYRCSDGTEFPDYESAYVYYCQKGDAGEGINFGPVTKTETVQVPYTETINHPEEGHWEYR